MFTSFQQGADDPANWNGALVVAPGRALLVPLELTAFRSPEPDTPSYLPGRFHAHALPPASQPTSRASSVFNLPFALSASTAGAGGAAPAGARGGAKPAPRARALKSGADSARRLFGNGGRGAAIGAEAETRTGEREALLRVRDRTGRALAEADEDGEADDEEDAGDISWLLLRPGRRRVKRWLSAWWRRWAVLVGFPCLIVWVWCSIPFPVSDPYKEEPPWHIPWPPSSDPPGVVESLLLRLPWLQPPDLTSSTADPVGKVVLDDRRRDEQHEQHVFDLEFVHETVSGSQALATARPRRGRAKQQAAADGAGHRNDEDLPVDANFYFFLVVYYGLYLAVALVFVTKLFDLYRLNWWPTSLGGTFSYAFFWTFSLLVGFLLHKFDLDGFGRSSSRTRHPGGGVDSGGADSWDWERKTTWVLLAFATMTMPALACFAKLRADRRNSWRRSLTPAQKTFLERQLTQRTPRSYKRFLWFLGTLALSLLALIIGQAFATVYLSTLPHSNVDGLVYIWTWIITVNVLNSVSNWILQRKVRSQALVFVFRFYYFLVYHVFYRNLFARLRSPDQAAWIQLLSSSFVIVWYPLSMSRTFHRMLKWSTGMPMEWPEYAHNVGSMLYLRNASENVTMVAFLGWLSILHWGPNQQIYPFFAFENRYDPYTYRLTLTASLVIWATELISSYLARLVCWIAYEVDVTNIGLNTFREHPELVVTCIWAATHVLMDILLFLVKLNFR
ncbi:hypothetical protein JCM1841_004408 [Sporobolomyces salmonicolor]